MKASDLKGRAVVTLSNAAKVGTVDDVYFDAQYRTVLGFRIKKGAFSHREAVIRANVSSIGADALTVASPDVINNEDRFAELAGAATLGKVDGTKVVTESGHLLGVVKELELDDDIRSVLTYTLDASLIDRLRHREPQISGQQVLRIGEGGIMIVANSAAGEESSSGS